MSNYLKFNIMHFYIIADMQEALSSSEDIITMIFVRSMVAWRFVLITSTLETHDETRDLLPAKK